jgi:hypothetical protein
VRVGDIVVLDGSASSDPDGPGGVPVRYEWVVVERPDGSVSQPVERFFEPGAPGGGGPEDDPLTPTAVFFVDLPGAFTFELRVTDEDGLTAPSEACPADASVNIRATQVEDLHVQLIWDTPADPDETDERGTDLDVHLRHPDAEDFFDMRLDCFSMNTNPDWGEPGDPADDPSLDFDDINGAGPENISISRVQDTDRLGAPYEAAVFYFDDADLGPTDATLRIYRDGDLAFDATRRLDRPGLLWHAASIHTGAEPRVVEVDEISER